MNNSKITEKPSEQIKIHRTSSKSPLKPSFPNHTILKSQNSIKPKDRQSLSKVKSSLVLKKKVTKAPKNYSVTPEKSPSTKDSNILRSKEKIFINYSEKELPIMNISNSISYRSNTPLQISGFDSDHSFSSKKNLKSDKKQKPLGFQAVVEKYEMYKRIFSSIIEKDKPFSTALKKIKEVYESFYEYSISEHTEKLKEKVTSQEKTIKEKDEEIAALKRKTKKLASENYEIAKSLERSEEICSVIQHRLNKIANFSLENYNMDKDTWKYLITENEAYSISIRNIEKELKASRKNEKKLRNIVREFSRGYIPQDYYDEHDYQSEEDCENEDTM